MHDIQKKLLNIAKRRNLYGLKLREIGDLLSISRRSVHPQRVKHHLNQLVKKGLLTINKTQRKIIVVEAGQQISRFVSIPIVGSANCGEATIIAEENIEGFLKVSASLLEKAKNICAILAVGDSMDKATVGKSRLNIQNGDYAIIDYKDRIPQNNDYVLSVIDGLANIKKFIKDDVNKQIVLISESAGEYSPIFIHEQDLNAYIINGKVIQVIKMPKIKFDY